MSAIAGDGMEGCVCCAGVFQELGSGGQRIWIVCEKVGQVESVWCEFAVDYYRTEGDSAYFPTTDLVEHLTHGLSRFDVPFVCVGFCWGTSPVTASVMVCVAISDPVSRELRGLYEKSTSTISEEKL